MCFIAGFVSQVSWTAFVIYFLLVNRTKLESRHNYGIIVKPFDIHLALFIQWRNIFVSTKTTGAGCCNDKTVQTAQFAPIMDF